MKPEKKCLIITGGEGVPLPEELRNTLEGSYVIACDSGYKNARNAGITPDLIIGDFDSAPLPDTKIPLRQYPTRKDDTDTMLAARHALELGYGDITIACGLGGRMDHAFANIQTGAFIVSSGGRARMIGKDTELYFFGRALERQEEREDASPDHGADEALQKEILRIPWHKGYSLSVFSLSDHSEGVSIRGTKYEVTGALITNTYPIGTSNVWSSSNTGAEISVRSGILLVILSRLTPGEHI